MGRRNRALRRRLELAFGGIKFRFRLAGCCQTLLRIVKGRDCGISVASGKRFTRLHNIGHGTLAVRGQMMEGTASLEVFPLGMEALCMGHHGSSCQNSQCGQRRFSIKTHCYDPFLQYRRAIMRKTLFRLLYWAGGCVIQLSDAGRRSAGYGALSASS